MTAVTVVLAVLNRERALRRALDSLRAQSFEDWECIVVDDGSSVDIGAVVAALGDGRIRYVRRTDTAGPRAARSVAWEMAQGDYVLKLDSDWELYPWALARGVACLMKTPSADSAVGLCVSNEDSRLLVRVVNAPRITTPAEFRRSVLAPDRIAMVRATIVREWLALPGKYFAFEWALWASAGLSHSSIALDEPWVLCHTSGDDRLSTSDAGRRRNLDDAVTFLNNGGDLMGDQPCLIVDRELEGIFYALTRARRPEAHLAAELLRKRGIAPRRALARQVVARAGRKLRRDRSRVFWV